MIFVTLSGRLRSCIHCCAAEAVYASKNPQFQNEKISARKRARSHINIEKSSKNLISLFKEMPAGGLP